MIDRLKKIFLSVLQRPFSNVFIQHLVIVFFFRLSRAAISFAQSAHLISFHDGLGHVKSEFPVDFFHQLGSHFSQHLIFVDDDLAVFVERSFSVNRGPDVQLCTPLGESVHLGVQGELENVFQRIWVELVAELLLADVLELLEAEVVGEDAHFHPVVIGEDFGVDYVACLEVEKEDLQYLDVGNGCL